MIMSSKKVNTDEYDTFECVNAENLIPITVHYYY